MIRSFIPALAIALAVMPGAVLADPGTAPDKVSQSSSVEQGHGVVAVSVRSAIWLSEPLHVYFLREGGNIDNDADVIRFTRKQGFWAIGNDTTDFLVKTFELPPGRYRLVAHGVKCPSVPEPSQTCRVRVEFAGSSSRISFPSRGYEGETPVFEVRAGAITYAGDYALDARNRIVWSRIPEDQLDKVQKRFAKLSTGPEPEIPLDWHMTGRLDRRGMLRDAGRSY